MDLLESFLRTANALEHIDKFRNEGIEVTSLKLLTDEDLKDLGIEDIEVRKKIIRDSEYLQISSEKRIDTKFDKAYVNTSLSQISQQLMLYNATLTPMAYKPDVVNVSVPLEHACEALSTAVDDLQNELLAFKQHVLKEKGIYAETSNRKSCLISGALFSIFMVTNILILKKIMSFIRH